MVTDWPLLVKEGVTAPKVLVTVTPAKLMSLIPLSPLKLNVMDEMELEELCLWP